MKLKLSNKSKIPLALILCPALFSSALAAPELLPEPAITERGAHHAVWERQSVQTLRDGRSVTNRHSYTELGTGLNYWLDGQWVPSREEIEIFQGAAVARQGQHSVLFAAQLNSPGAIDLLAPDGGRFRSHVIGLAYSDAASGRSVMIATVKDSIGAVLPPNQVIYQDAFTGDFLADVRYTYTKGAFEQDIILLTAPPSPSAFGLSDEFSRMEVITEFLDLPEGTMTPVLLKQENDPVRRRQMAEPDLIDYRLDFGTMKMEQGQAFPLGDPDPFSGSTVPTAKSIERIDDRVFLVERVDYADIRAHLAQLPQHAAAANIPRSSRGHETPFERGTNQSLLTSAATNAGGRAVRNIAAADVRRRTPLQPGGPNPPRDLGGYTWNGLLPPAPKGQRGVWKEKQYAKVDDTRKGFVLDYILLNGSLTNQVFQGDTTYYLTNAANLYGTTVLEGGAVLKFNGGKVTCYGPVDCLTAPYRPATFTARDDDTIGEIISGSSGAPSGTYSTTMLTLADTAATYTLQNLRLFHAYLGIQLNSAVKADLSHLQIGKSRSAVGQIGTSVATCRNFLFHDLTLTGFITTGTVTNRSEHGTVHRAPYYTTSTNAFTLTNSLLISVTNNCVTIGANLVTNVSDSGYFQTVGAATHYLADGSTNRGAGTTNINATLLADLQKRTTYPPSVLTNNITSATNFATFATRSGATPDLGYAYDPLDYAARGLTISNATVTLAPGVAVGTYGASGESGLQLLAGATLLAEGTPLAPCRFVRYNLVQEPAVTNWSASSAGWSLNHSYDAAPSAQAGFRFTEWSAPAAAPDHIYSGGTSAGTNWFRFRDCAFYNGGVNMLSSKVALTNCLFHRAPLLVYGLASETRHCTFVSGSWSVDGTLGSHNARDNLFDKTAFDASYYGVTNDYNAYLSGYGRMVPTNAAHHVTLTSLTYEKGPLGWFYLPTNSPLLNTGSVSAASAGLYHHTTTTNQWKETNSTVDIGMHYVAVSTQSATLHQPVDTDGSTVPDYAEDRNGNGTYDPGADAFVGETDWQAPFDIIANFAGIKQQGESGWHVPDSFCAVGPKHFMVVLNGTNSVAVYDKNTGLQISPPTTLRNLFTVSVSGGTPYDGTYPNINPGAIDSRIIFDHESQRWIASTLELTTTYYRNIILAVSNGPDPFGSGGTNWVEDNWKKYLLPFAEPSSCCDFDGPTLSVDKNGIYICARNDSCFCGPFDPMVKIAALPKTQFVTNPPTAATLQTNFIISFTNYGGGISVYAAPNFDSISTTDPAWFIFKQDNKLHYNGLWWTNGTSAMPQWILSVPGNPGAWPSLTITNPFSELFFGDESITAPQPGTDAKRIEMLSQFMVPVLRKFNGVQYLWTSHAIGVNSQGGHDTNSNPAKPADRSGIA